MSDVPPEVKPAEMAPVRSDRELQEVIARWFAVFPVHVDIMSRSHTHVEFLVGGLPYQTKISQITGKPTKAGLKAYFEKGFTQQ